MANPAADATWVARSRFRELADDVIADHEELVRDEDLVDFGFNYLGAWSALTNYIVFDAVEYEGLLYLAIKDSKGKIPNAGEGYWLAPGAQGPPGEDGKEGPEGPVNTETQEDLEAHEADSTGVHGIADTSKLVTGPGSSVAGTWAAYDDTTGKVLRSAAESLSKDGTFASNSDALVPSQKATKTYVDLRATKVELESEKSSRETADAERVVGPASATDLRVAIFDGTTGKKVKDGGTLLSALATKVEVEAKASKTELTNHEADTTAIHGITDTSVLVTGPASATSGRVATYNGTTGKIIQDGGTLLSALLTKAEFEAGVGFMSQVTGCLAKRATEQTITKETVTALSFSETEYDDGDCWVIGSPTRLTVPTGQGGLYYITWTTTILPSSLSGEKEIWFRLNGNEKLRIATTDYIGPADMQTLTAITRLSAADYIECCTYLETTENGKFAKDEYNVADDLQRVRFERIR